jgi:uncharacterized protein
MAPDDELAAWQSAFADALRGAPAGADEFAQAPDVVVRRLALYRGNVVANAVRALESAYPVARRIVGDEFFAALARAFWRVAPARSGDLNDYGEELAAFIDGFPPCADLPYLGDVARLEWQVHRAHFAADAEPFALQTLAAVPDAGQVHLPFHPAAALVETMYQAAAIWRAHQSEAGDVALPARIEGAQHAVVARPHFTVDVHAVDAAMFTWLSALRAGAVLAAATAAALAAAPTFDLARALASAEAWGVLAV